MQNKGLRITRRDIEILHFMWKWKVCTSRCLCDKFFEGNGKNTYKRLRELKKDGFIRLTNVGQETREVAWTLDKKGYERIRSGLPVLSNEGFAPNYAEHDYIVAACHLGEWLANMPQGVETFSEQELFRIDEAYFPEWVPGVQVHRPDGYWKIPYGSGFAVIALEVELHIKNRVSYVSVGEWYRYRMDRVTRIVWVVQNAKEAFRIRRDLKKSDPENFESHIFVTLPDFKERGWEAQIIHGNEAGKSLKFCLCLGQMKLVNLRENGSKLFSANFLLENSICVKKTRTSEKKNTPNFCDSIALRLSSNDLYSAQNTPIASAPMYSATEPKDLFKEVSNNE